jgi:hypothetical protein
MRVAFGSTARVSGLALAAAGAPQSSNPAKSGAYGTRAIFGVSAVPEAHRPRSLELRWVSATNCESRVLTSGTSRTVQRSAESAPHHSTPVLAVRQRSGAIGATFWRGDDFGRHGVDREAMVWRDAERPHNCWQTDIEARSRVP